MPTSTTDSPDDHSEFDSQKDSYQLANLNDPDQAPAGDEVPAAVRVQEKLTAAGSTVAQLAKSAGQAVKHRVSGTRTESSDIDAEPEETLPQFPAKKAAVTAAAGAAAVFGAVWLLRRRTKRRRAADETDDRTDLYHRGRWM